MSRYEMPTNDMFEKMLKQNLDHTKPLEMREKKLMDGKALFPFWTPVANDGVENFTDYKDYLTEKDKKKRDLELNDQTGIVKPNSEFKTVGDKTKETTVDYEDNSIMGIMQKFIKNINHGEWEDNTGVVKPTTEFKTTVNGDTVTTKTVSVAVPKIANIPANAIKTDTTTKTKVDSNAAKPKGDLVGIVKPSNAFTTTTVTKWDGSTTTVKQEIGVPIIKKDGGQIVELKSEAEVKVDSNAAKPKGDLVGVVKAKDALTKQNVPTDIIKGSKSANVSDVTNKTNGIDAKTTTNNKVPTNAPKMNPVLGDKTGVVKPKSEVKADPKPIKFK
jgi:hypothetical protein